VLFREEPLLRVRAVLALLIFATFSVLWTSMVLPLSAPPMSLSHTGVGLFGLAGVAGALGAGRAGQLADRGWGQWTTGAALALMLMAWLPIAFTLSSLWALVIGVVLLDLAIQAVHVTNQSMLLAVRPDARSRLVGGYMVFYSIGSASGSIASTLVYAWTGWPGVCALGAAISMTALLFWAATRQIR
jgi:predicted MFS family arabinose efflux permease